MTYEINENSDISPIRLKKAMYMQADAQRRKGAQVIKSGGDTTNPLVKLIFSF